MVVARIYEYPITKAQASRHTFESTNLLIVAIMSLCPSTSSRELGLYFSTLVNLSKDQLII